MPTPVVEARDLSKDYGSTVGLEGLDLIVERGEVLGFLGPNGAGKTTTIRLLLDLIRPTRGAAFLFGIPVGEPGARASVGYLPGELELDERLTGTGMLTLLDSLRPAGSPAADPARRSELCERLRLSAGDLGRPIRDDSRGTKQKVGLVAAFQGDPDLLILDEPTTGLDPLVREEVFSLLSEAGAEGRTVFHSSHVLSEVDRTCTRVAVLRAGRLVAVERIDALRASMTRRMVIRFRDAVPERALDVPGATVIERDGPRVVLEVTGEIDPLLEVLARHSVEYLAFPEPELDAAFRPLYEEPGAGDPVVVTRALLLRNLRHHRRLIAALLAGVFGLQVLIVVIAAGFESGPGLETIFEALPRTLRTFVRVQIGELSFDGFVAFGFQHPAVLAMSIAFVVLTATVPAAERESGVLDLFLARPLARSRYLGASVWVVALGALALPACQLAGAALGIALVEIEDPPSWTTYAPSALGLAALLLAVGGLALLFAAGAERRGTAVARILAVVLATYVVHAFAGFYGPLERVSWLSPFHYFRPIQAALSGPSARDLGVLSSVAGVTGLLAFVRFSRRDT